jgi:hypothetical protein
MKFFSLVLPIFCLLQFYSTVKAEGIVPIILNESKQYSKMIGLVTVAAIAYGIAHDQIAARVCLEYFTKGSLKEESEEWQDTPIFEEFHTILKKNENSPTIVGTVWGIAKTWDVGLGLGTGLALSARAGWLPKMRAEDLQSPLAKAMLITGGISLIAGTIGYGLAKYGKVQVPEDSSHGVSPEKKNAWYANAVSVNTAYCVGALTGLGLCAWTIKQRSGM